MSSPLLPPKATDLLEVYPGGKTDDPNQKPSQVIDTRSVGCANLSCTAGQQVPFFQCSKCHSRKYCSKSCQKQDWSARHKKECSTLYAVDLMQGPAVKDAFDYSMVLCDHLDEELRVPARSALLLGRLDSIGTTHFIAIHISYSPPKKRVDLNNIIAVRKLFKVLDVGVVADKDARDDIRQQLAEARRAQTADHKPSYAIVHLHTRLTGVEMGEFFSHRVDLGNHFAPAQDDFRSINPHWKRLVRNVFERDHYEEDRALRLLNGLTEDLEMYESPEYVEEHRVAVKRFKELAQVYRVDEAYQHARRFASKWAKAEAEKKKKKEEKK